MLKDKRAGLFDMALQANGILAGGSSQLCVCESAMLIVAIGALDQLFINPVMKGLGKIWFNFGMAPIAQLRQRFHQQVLRLAIMMRRVTVKAVYVAVLVGGAQKITVLFSMLMAGEAGGADFVCRGAFERNNLRRIAARLHMFPARAMARLALSRGCGCIAFVKCDLPVRRGGKVFVEVSMTIFAAL